MFAEISAQLLPFSLCLTKIEVSELEKWGPTLVRLALYDRCRFFSFTLCDGEASLVIDDKAARTLSPDLASNCEVFGGIQLMEGPHAINLCGIVSAVTSPLAPDLNILYMSTFATDIILVDRANVAQVLQQINTQLSVIADQQQQGQMLEQAVSPLLEASALALQSTVLVSRLSSSLSVCNITADNLQAATHPLVRFLLFPPNPTTMFFSLTSQTHPHQETTLVLDSLATSLFLPSTIDLNSQTWCALRVAPGASISASPNLVAPVSRRLARANVPVFYLSTFAVDLALVPESHASHAAQALKKTDDVATEL